MQSVSCLFQIICKQLSFFNLSFYSLSQIQFNLPIYVYLNLTKSWVFFSEHQEISNEINEATDTKVREDLERELEALVSRMEAKSQQISKVRKHQQKVYM
jgi:hypothetical protein